MEREPSDPRVVRSIAVTAGDVVAALEARRQRDEPVLLRITPPFSGRMRARLHLPRHDGATDADSVCVTPDQFLEETAPDYPGASDTGDAVREQFVDRVEVDAPDGSHRIDVAVLG